MSVQQTPSDKARKPSIARGVARLTALSIAIMGILVVLLVGLRINGVMQELRHEHLHHESQILVAEFERFLTNQMIVLRDHAAFPVMRQGVLQPEQMRGYVSDFMQNLSVIGRRYKETLVDFQGRTVYSTRPELEADYSHAPWMQKVISGEVSELVMLHDIRGEYYWCIVIPVEYQGFVEGALITEIPLSAMSNDYQLNERLSDMYIRLLQGDQEVAHYGQPQPGGAVYLADWPAQNLRFEFQVDDTAMHNQRWEILLQLVLLVASVAIAMVLLAYRWGQRAIARPILYLQQEIRRLSVSKNKDPIDEASAWREVQDVARGFNRMLRRIDRREQQLKQSNQDLGRMNRQLQQSQDQLVHAEKMASLGTLAAGVAHEINNPIGYVKSNLGTLEGYLASMLRYQQFIDRHSEAWLQAFPEQCKQLAELRQSADIDYVMEDAPQLISESKAGVERVADIVTNLKSFAHVGETEMARVNMNTIIQDTLKVIWNELKYKTSVYEDYGDLPEIDANAGQLQQVIINLLMNAVQAIETRGEIFIASRYCDGQIIISVRDTGCGIAADNMKDLFTPFYTSKKVGEGTGLGLSISHGIIEKHGGSIKVTSEPGKGTEFRISLPATTAAAQQD